MQTLSYMNDWAQAHATVLLLIAIAFAISAIIDVTTAIREKSGVLEDRLERVAARLDEIKKDRRLDRACDNLSDIRNVTVAIHGLTQDIWADRPSALDTEQLRERRARRRRLAKIFNTRQGGLGLEEAGGQVEADGTAPSATEGKGKACGLQ